MKDMITTIASIILLMIFVFQFTVNQVTHNRVFRADMAVETFREKAGFEGCVSPLNKAILMGKLKSISGCSDDEIRISGSEEVLPQGEVMHYSVSFPLKEIIASAKLLNISESQNRGNYSISGYIVSRHEEPDEPIEDLEGTGETG